MEIDERTKTLLRALKNHFRDKKYVDITLMHENDYLVFVKDSNNITETWVGRLWDESNGGSVRDSRCSGDSSNTDSNLQYRILEQRANDNA